MRFCVRERKSGWRDSTLTAPRCLAAQVEALCSRVGIVHAGRLACVGSPQRLKSVYGGARPAASWPVIASASQHDATPLH